MKSQDLRNLCAITRNCLHMLQGQDLYNGVCSLLVCETKANEMAKDEEAKAATEAQTEESK